MKLSLVTETYPPEINGVAMTLSRLVGGMVARGHHVEVVRPRQHRNDHGHENGSPPGSADGSVAGNPSGGAGGAGGGASGGGGVCEFTVAGLPLPRYDGLHFGLPARGKLLERWRRTCPEVVHIATEGPLGVTALMAAKKLGIPVSSSFHTNFHQYGKHYGFNFVADGVLRYLGAVHNRTSCTMVPSADVQEMLQRRGFRNVMVLARGVDAELFNPRRRSAELRKQWGAGEDDLVCLYVGRVAGEKNIPLAIEAFEAIRKRVPGAKLVIVGDGPAKAPLQKKHPEYVYAGKRLGEELAAHYASGDLFLFPSTTETFGNVVTEAMASGLPVLAFNYAAPQQFIRSGENGVTVPFGDAAAYVKAAESMAADRAALAAMGVAARESVLGVSWGAIIEQFEATLRQVADHGQINIDG